MAIVKLISIPILLKEGKYFHIVMFTSDGSVWQWHQVEPVEVLSFENAQLVEGIVPEYTAHTILTVSYMHNMIYHNTMSS